MSRHELPAKLQWHKVIVGWDHPLQTFFIQVIDRRKEASDEDEKFVLWRGCFLREIYEVEDVVRLACRYADVSPEIGATLYGDKDEGR